MAITRYAGDRFTANTSDTKPTGVLDGAYLIDTGNLTQWVRRTAGGTSQWNQLAGGGGGGGTPGGANTQVQFNNAGAFGGDADLTFTDGNRLNVNKLGISGNIYDSNNSIGNNGMVLTNEGTTGVNWKSIESVLSGVGGSGVANYVARWSDEDTITSGVIQDDGTAVGINQAADPDNALAIKSIANNTNPLQIAAHDGDSLLVFRQTAGDGRLSIKKDGGVETIRLDSDNVSYITGGNFGIGTNSPDTKLHILGDNGDQLKLDNDGDQWTQINLANNDSSKTFLALDYTNHIFVLGAQGSYSDLKYISFRPDGVNDDMVIKRDGNVGIGTTNPNAKLKVDTGNIRLTNDYYVEWGGNKARIGGSTAGDYVFFLTDNTDRMRIVSSGSVGIGTNAPAGKLHIFSSDLNNNLILESSETGGSTAPDLVLYRSSTSAADNDYIGVIRFRGKNDNGTPEDVEYGAITSQIKDSTDGNEDGELALWTMEGGTLTQQVTLNSVGSVGIGTDAPAYTLQVAGNIGVNEYIRHNGDSNTNIRFTDDDINFKVGGVNFLDFTEDTVSEMTINEEGANLDVRIEGDTDANLFFTDASTDKVGIGTNAPAAKLDLRSSDSVVAYIIRPSASPTVHIGSAISAGAQLGYVHAHDYAFYGHDAAYNAIVVKSDGDVGIGTTDPNTLLHLEDDTATAGLTLQGAGPGYANAAIVLKATNGTSVRGLGVFMHDAGGDTEWYAGTPYAAADNYVIARKASQASPDYGTAIMANALFTIDNNGNVGLGITDPAHNLHVSGDAIISGYLYDSTNSTGVDGYVLTSKEDGPQWQQIEDVLSGVGGNGTANYIPKWEDEDTIGDSVIAQSGTAIGIGTAAPATSLEVLAADPVLTVRDTEATVASASATLRLAESSATNTLNGHFDLKFAGSASGGDLDISRYNNTSLVAQGVRIKHDGNVGIGTNNPAFKLQVQTPAVPANNAYVVGFDVSRPNSASRGFTVGSNSAADTWTLGAHNADMRLGHTYGTDTGGQPTFYPDLTIKHSDQSAGNVGIGTTDPGGKLESYITSGGEKGLRLNSNFAGGNTVDFIPAIVGVSNAGFSIDLAGTNRLVINSNGKVGIGTNAPVTLLDVYHATHSQITISSAGNQDSSLSLIEQSTSAPFGSASVYGFQWKYDGGDNKLYLSSGVDTNVVNRLTVQRDDGNVGVGGIVSPVGRLHVKSGGSGSYVIRGQNSSGNDLGGLYDASGSAEIYLKTAATATGVKLDSAGDSYFINSVGIGTANPSYPLDIEHASTPTVSIVSAAANVSPRLIIDAGGGAGTADPHVKFDSDGVDWSVGVDQSDGDKFKFAASNGLASEKVVIQRDGNVGIGINDPESLLHVHSATNETTAIISSVVNSTSGSYLRLTEGGESFATYGYLGGYIQYDGSNNLIHFGRHNVNGTSLSDDNPVITIERDTGDVGIGTTSPSNKLQVVGGATSVNLAVTGAGEFSSNDFGTTFKTTNTNQKRSQIFFKDSADAITSRIGNDIEGADNAKLQFIAGSGSTPHMSILSGGNVGIGTVTPNFAAAAGNTVKGLNIQNVGQDTQASLRLTGHNATGNPGVATYTELLHAGANLRFDINHNGTVRFSIGSGGAITFNSAFTFPTAIGSAGQVLKVPSSGTVLEWSTETGPVSGTGTTNTIPRWTGTASLGDSIITVPSNTSVQMAGPLTLNYTSPILNIGKLNTSTGNAKLQFNSKNGTAANAYIIEYVKSATEDRLDFVGGGGTAEFSFLNSGQVGIGTTAPASLLHVGGAAATPHAAADDFVIAPAATDVGMTIRCNSNSGTGSIFFADTAANGQGTIRYNHNSDYMSFYSTGDFFFDGSVGIGTNAPNELLEVDGNIRLGDGTHRNIIGPTNATLGIYSNPNDSNEGIKFSTDGGSTIEMFLQDGGNLGIATTNPAAKLDVSGNILRSGLYYNSWTSRSINSLTSGGSTINYILIAPKTTINVRLSGRFNCARGNGVSAVSIAHADVVFCTDNDASPQSGGIHSAASDIPSYGHANFELVELTYNSADYYALKISPSVSWVASFNHIEFEGVASNVTWTNVDSGNVSNIGAFGGSQAVFAYEHANVGIGTNSPSARLHITSDGSHDEGAEIVLRHDNNNSTDVVSTLSFQNNGGQVAMIQAGTTSGNTNGYISLFTDNSGTSAEKMRIISDGKIGIGTTDPGVTLDVRGKLSIGSPNASYDLYNNGTTYLNDSVTIDALLSITGTAASQSIINSSTTDSAAADSYLNIFKTAGSGGGSRATLRVGYDAANCFQVSRIRNNPHIYINSRQSGSEMVFQIADTEQMALSSGQLKFPDNKKIIMGASNDLQIYHNGSDSIIADSGTGGIKIDSNYTAIRSANGSETAAKFLENGAVELYYDNAKRFETLSNGAKVTQYLYGSDGEILAGQDSNGYYFATGAGQNVNKPIFIGDNASYIQFKTSDVEVVRIDANGNIGIGTTTTNAKLHVYLTGSAGSFSNIGLFRAGPDSNDSGAEIFVGQQGNSRGLVIRGGRGTGDQALAHFYLNQSGGTIPSATQNHVMTFLQGGYVGIGTTNPGTYKLLVDGTTYIDDYLIVDGNIHFDTLGNYISFYGDNSRNHAIVANNSLGNAADDLRINTYGALYINLDSNSNNTSGADFSIGRHGSTGTLSDWLLDLSGETGKLRLYKYGSGTHTGTAAYQLSVDSSGNIIETTDGGGNISGSGTANKVAKFTGANTIGNSQITDNGTSVGINVSPNAANKLQVNGQARATTAMFGNSSVSNTAAKPVHIKYGGTAELRLEDSTSSNYVYDISADFTNGFRITDVTSTLVPFTIQKTTGHVGIGTTSPTYKLDVETASEIVASFVSTDNKAAINISDDDTAVYVSAENSKGSFGFNVGVHANNLNIASSGNVGIGTATPRTNLHVYGTGVDNGLAKIRIGGNTNNTAMLELAETENGSGVMTYGFSMRADGGSGGGSTNDFQLRYHNNSTSGVIGMTMQRTTGQVGIGGVYSGTHRLYVYGDGYMTGNLGLGGTLTEASSLAIKENIETFEPSLDIINKIRPVKYDKKTTGKKEIGLIAEELAELFPELVEKDKNGNPSGVNYSRAVTVLLGGFKELYKEVQELKKRI